MDTYFEIRRFLITITSNNNRRLILDIFICGYMLEITHIVLIIYKFIVGFYCKKKYDLVTLF